MSNRKKIKKPKNVMVCARVTPAIKQQFEAFIAERQEAWDKDVKMQMAEQRPTMSTVLSSVIAHAAEVMNSAIDTHKAIAMQNVRHEDSYRTMAVRYFLDTWPADDQPAWGQVEATVKAVIGGLAEYRCIYGEDGTVRFVLSPTDEKMSAEDLDKRISQIYDNGPPSYMGEVWKTLWKFSHPTVSGLLNEAAQYAATVGDHNLDTVNNFLEQRLVAKGIIQSEVMPDGND